MADVLADNTASAILSPSGQESQAQAQQQRNSRDGSKSFIARLFNCIPTKLPSIEPKHHEPENSVASQQRTRGPSIHQRRAISTGGDYRYPLHPFRRAHSEDASRPVEWRSSFELGEYHSNHEIYTSTSPRGRQGGPSSYTTYTPPDSSSLEHDTSEGHAEKRGSEFSSSSSSDHSNNNNSHSEKHNHNTKVRDSRDNYDEKAEDSRDGNGADPIVPDGGPRAWLTVLGSFFTFTAGFGLLNSVGILQAYLENNQLAAFAPRDVAWIPALNIFLCMSLGVQVGPLFDRFGPRWLMGVGSVVYVSGLVTMSFLGPASCGENCDGQGGRRFTSLLLTWGIMVGGAAALLMTTALSVTGHWFDKRRGLANGMVFVGSSVGGIMFPLVMRACFEKLMWRTTMLIVAGIVCLLLVMGNLLIQGRFRAGGKGGGRGTIDLKCFRDWRFVWTVAGTSLFQFVVVGAMGMLPTWVRMEGFDEDHAFNVVALVNAGSGVGRIAAGALSDHIGRYNTVIMALIWTMLITMCLWGLLHETAWLIYLFGPLYGIGTGSLISMAPVCVGQLCNSYEFGRYYGTSQSVVSIFTLVCIPLSATIMQAFSPFVLVLVFGCLLGGSTALFFFARWSCLEYKWQWKVKV